MSLSTLARSRLRETFDKADVVPHGCQSSFGVTIMERGAWRSHIAAAGGRAAHITGRGSCEQFDAPKCGAVLPSLINLARVLVEALSFFERTMPISSSCFYWVD